MRVYLLAGVFMTAFWATAFAQEPCSSFTYQQQQSLVDPSFKTKMQAVETFIQQQKTTGSYATQRGGSTYVITIPVVVHVLYHTSDENVPDQFIINQLKTMTDCYRRLNADSVNTPDRFKALAADCEIEFKLAISDPNRKATSGIIRKYTNTTKWMSDDKMKFASTGGDDAWDSKSYLNVWVCNLNYVLGYATFPGGDATKDGVVINYNAMKWNKTMVHETGHWFGLHHTWGDSDCGDDYVDDTPKQSSPTPGCPSGIRLSCNNGPNGDMYMNYMDVTGDACTNLFTEGQKARIRAIFETGGARNAILTSYALKTPTTTSEIPPPGEDGGQPITVLPPKIFPNPAGNETTLDISDNKQLIGNTIIITNTQGQVVTTSYVNAKLTRVNVSMLKPGIYFLTTKAHDGTSIKQKLVKL
ncbi:MAG: M43 family zinc metalloprotease [Chitinophagaceae bacterium]